MATHTPNDEVLSALLDAEPVGADAAHVARCAQCQDRLAELRAAAVAIGTPPPHAAPHVRAAAVARAVDGAFEAADLSRGGIVTPLRRRRRSSVPLRRVAPLPAAAALVALIVAAGWMLTLVTSSGEHTVGSGAQTGEPSAGALRATAEADSEAGEPGEEVGLGAGTVAIPESPQSMDAAAGAGPDVTDGGDLGAVEDLAAVTRRADSDLAGARKLGRPRPCRAQAEAIGTLEWQAALTYKGRAATAYVVRDGDGKRITQVWSAQDCSLIDRRTA